MKIYELIAWLLVLILAISSLGRFMIAIINPEAFFFGIKLGGVPARLFLSINGLFGILLIVLLLRKNYFRGLALALLFFFFMAVEVYVSYETVAPLIAVAVVFSVSGLLSLKYKI